MSRPAVLVAVAYVAALVGILAGFGAAGTILLVAGVVVSAGLCMIPDRRP